jgi:hypothetical protein
MMRTIWLVATAMCAAVWYLGVAGWHVVVCGAWLATAALAALDREIRRMEAETILAQRQLERMEERAEAGRRLALDASDVLDGGRRPRRTVTLPSSRHRERRNVTKRVPGQGAVRGGSQSQEWRKTKRDGSSVES